MPGASGNSNTPGYAPSATTMRISRRVTEQSLVFAELSVAPDGIGSGLGDLVKFVLA